MARFFGKLSEALIFGGANLMQQSRQTILRLTGSAMIAALTAVTTAYVFHVPMSLFGGQGYVHVGDAVIYLGASLLPVGYACSAAAIGGALADVLSGAPLWAPFTFVIKALMVLCFTSARPKILHKRNYLALLLAAIVTVAGYYAAEAVLYGNLLSPVYSITGNLLQASSSAVLYIILGLALDKIQIKKELQLR